MKIITNIKHLLIIPLVLLLGSNHQNIAQNVGIGSESFTPHESAMLEVKATDKGMLVPRVDIEDLSTAAPVTNPAVSLLVYNTNETTGEGFYYWDGDAWVAVGGSNSSSSEPCIGSYEVFNSSGTWTKPNCGSVAFVQCWGGGGSGRRSGSLTSQSGGGGGGGYAERIVHFSQIQTSTVEVTVGAGGAFTTGTGNGNDGGDSSFGTFLIAYGGGGAGQSGKGPVHLRTWNAGASGGGAAPSLAGDTKHSIFGGGSGAIGGHFNNLPGSSYYGGGGGGYYNGNCSGSGCVYEHPGGTSVYGGAGGHSRRSTNGEPGQVPGGGGGATGTGTRSGAGGNGRCIITTW